MKLVVAHARRLAILALNFLLNRDYVFRAVGLANRRRKFLGSIFVLYPASEEYARAYVYTRHLKLLRWSPWLVGLFKQDGKWGVTFGISSTEADFVRCEHTSNLRLLVDRAEQIRLMLCADQKTFAGILPGILSCRRLIKSTTETDVTVECVIRAEEKVRQVEGLENHLPVIVLGARGHVGRRVVNKLEGRELYCVDADGSEAWPSHLAHKPAILINLTRQAALQNYLGLFWSELVLINEVYPEPGAAEIEQLKRIGGTAYHIVGVSASAFPSFPRAYQGGIPCCAARVSDTMDVIVRKLV